MERIASDERFRTICANGLGVVFNDFVRHGTSAAQYNVVHLASCRWLARSSLSVPKLWFEDLASATDWLVRERGAEGQAWKRCATCVGGSSTPARSTEQPALPVPISSSSGDADYLIAADAAGSRVDAWSTTRLPFEPTGTMLQMRAGLRDAIAQLSADSHLALRATYTSPLGGRFDVENVLLYNVGTSAFARSAGSELVVERTAGPTPIPPSPLEGSAHHYAYAITEGDIPWQTWSIVRRLASFESVEVASLAAAARPSSVWLAIRRGSTADLTATDASSAIGLEMGIELPASAPTNLAALAKPLIDGVISAFHAHDDPRTLDLVAERVAAQIGAPAAEIRSLLQQNESAILGSRRLLWPWREGVQWNPADDRCAAFRIRRVDQKAR